MDEVALSFQVLGPIRAQLGDRPLDLGGPKQRAVLAAMLLETGHVVSTDRLSDAAWGDHPPLNALAGLQVYISNLRRILRDRSLSSSPIVRRNPGYLIDVPPEAIDTGRFVAGCARTRQLVEAARWHEATVEADRTLGLWHGPLAQEFADQDWVGVAAPPFEERRLTCRQDLITSLLGEQRAAEALNRASVLAREHPLDEKACWLYALTLHQLGRTADALAGLAAFAQTLDDELGLRPGPALRDLQGSILRLDPSLETWPNSPSRTVPGVVEPPSPTVAPQAAGDRRPDPSTLIGRQAELGAIEAAWRGLERGACVWVLVTGPAGIGKSRIVGESILRQTREISGALPSSPRVLRVTCPDDAALPAWWPVRQLLKGLGVDPDAVLGSSEGTDTEVTRFAVYERVTDQVRRAAADSALVIVVDDVHWADFSTVTLLAHFAETVHVPGTAWLLTARDEIDHIDDGRLVSALARRTDAVRVRLPPLDPDEVSELVTQISGETLEPSEVTAVVERTGGNAFFVTEYARLPRSERIDGQVPVAVRSLMERRLASLGPAGLAVLRTAALIGEPLDLGVLRQVCGLDTEALADLLDAAADAQVLAPDDRGFAFAHALLRGALVSGLSPVRAQTLHLRIADALDGRPDSDSLARRADHLINAGSAVEPARVVDACRVIAQDADRRWDADEAVRWWEAALQAHNGGSVSGGDERDNLTVSLLSALVRAGQGRRMLAVVDSSLLEAWREGRTASVGRVASILLRLTGAWPWPAYATQPNALLSRLSGLEPHLRDHPAAHARVLATMAVGSCYDLDPDVADTLSSQAIKTAEASGDADALADALVGRAILYGGVVGRAAETLSLLERLSRLRHRQERFDEVIGHGVASKTTLATGDLAATTTHVRAGARLATELRLPVSRAQFRWAEYALAAWQSSDLTATEQLIDAAYHQHQQTELTQSVSVVFARLGARWEQGRLNEGVGRVDNPYIAPWIGAVVAAARQDDDAEELLAAEIARPEPTVWTSHGRWTLLAHAVADAGAARLAPAILPHLIPLSGAIGTLGHVAVLGPVDLARARVHLCAAEVDAARSALDAATATANRSQAVNWQLRCRALGFEIAIVRGSPPDPSAIDRTRAAARSRGLLGVVADLDRVSGRTPGQDQTTVH